MTALCSDQKQKKRWKLYRSSLYPQYFNFARSTYPLPMKTEIGAWVTASNLGMWASFYFMTFHSKKGTGGFANVNLSNVPTGSSTEKSGRRDFPACSVIVSGQWYAASSSREVALFCFWNSRSVCYIFVQLRSVAGQPNRTLEYAHRSKIHTRSAFCTSSAVRSLFVDVNQLWFALALTRSTPTIPVSTLRR